MIDRSGQHIGNYRLIRLLGGGTFAEVYLGEHLFLRAPVAVKVLRSSLTPSSQQAFLREAQVCALRRSFRPVLGYLAVFMFSAAWGMVGWIVGMSMHFRWLPSLVLPIPFAIIGFLIALCIHSYSLPVMLRNRYL